MASISQSRPSTTSPEDAERIVDAYRESKLTLRAAVSRLIVGAAEKAIEDAQALLPLDEKKDEPDDITEAERVMLSLRRASGVPIPHVCGWLGERVQANQAGPQRPVVEVERDDPAPAPKPERDRPPHTWPDTPNLSSDLKRHARQLRDAMLDAVSAADTETFAGDVGLADRLEMAETLMHDSMDGESMPVVSFGGFLFIDLRQRLGRGLRQESRIPAVAVFETDIYELPGASS